MAIMVSEENKTNPGRSGTEDRVSSCVNVDRCKQATGFESLMIMQVSVALGVECSVMWL